MTTKNSPKLNYFQRFTYTVVTCTELFFYRLGYNVGRSPKKTITLCTLFVIITSFGFLRFHQEKNPMRLWVPPGTKFFYDTEWLIEKYQTGFRDEIVQLVADDVLQPSVLLELLKLDKEVKSIQTNNVTWNEVCFKIPKIEKGMLRWLEGNKKTNGSEKDMSTTMNAALYCSFVDTMSNECFIYSILDLWDTNEDIIKSLSKKDIIEAINNYDRQGIMSRLKNYENILGGIERNETGHIISAKSLQNVWMVTVNFTAVDVNTFGNNAGTADWASNDVLDWENAFFSSRSFGDISSATMFQDIGILCIGIFIMVIYVQLVISKFNWIEARVCLGCMGLLAVGMAFIAGCGLCSLFGVSYGPVHTSLPFLLMGLGIDDMFVILACWEELSKEQKKLPTCDRIGLILKHAGVSISVTSVTDIFAFLIGSYTILPCLESFCIYAALCVFMTFVFAITFFTACFALDQERVERKGNGIVICYTHDTDYTPNECSQKQTSNWAFNAVFDHIVLTIPGKVVVIIITLLCLGFSIESIPRLEQRFDPEWFIPEHTYLQDYVKVRSKFFGKNGFNAGIYMGSINYTHEFLNIKSIVDDLETQQHIVFDIISWVEPFRDFVLLNFHTDVYEEVLSDNYFNAYLSMFLFTPKYALYQANFRFENPVECGASASKIIMSSIDFRFHIFSGPEEHLPAMHKVRDIVSNSNISTGDKFVTVWSKIFATWTTDEVIEMEVLRNLQLALVAVMGCTFVLIADVQICLWIFLCVLLTMVNVCGFMQRWGLTIDMVSCIGLELAIGLCVDYATHIGHTFLTVKEGTRRNRTLKTVTSIGSAVVYGGLSTLIGVFMLSQSEAYTFQAFFKIFLLIIIFGLFHGVVLLPVILSFIGPKPYNVKKLTTAPEDIGLVDTQI